MKSEIQQQIGDAADRQHRISRHRIGIGILPVRAQQLDGHGIVVDGEQRLTGIITDVGTLLSVEPRGDLKRLRIASHYSHDSLVLGASVAHNGVCMTLVGFGPREDGDGYASWHEVDAAAETLAVTTAGSICGACQSCTR